MDGLREISKYRADRHAIATGHTLNARDMAAEWQKIRSAFGLRFRRSRQAWWAALPMFVADEFHEAF